MEESDNGRFLRTVLTKDVYVELEDFAQQYTTGMGKWDFGVAIKILLDFYKAHSTVAQINSKLDLVLSQMFVPQEEEKLEDNVKEDSGTEMLGGEKIQ